MTTDKIAEPSATRAKLEKLESSIASEMRKELAGLPAQYGFESTEAFILAVREAAGGRHGPKQGVASKGKRRTRTVITDETRAQVKKLVGEGSTGADIAKKLGISLPSVQNIKKALGLVRERK